MNIIIKLKIKELLQLLLKFSISFLIIISIQLKLNFQVIHDGSSNTYSTIILKNYVIINENDTHSDIDNNIKILMYTDKDKIPIDKMKNIFKFLEYNNILLEYLKKIK